VHNLGLDLLEARGSHINYLMRKQLKSELALQIIAFSVQYISEAMHGAARLYVLHHVATASCREKCMNNTQHNHGWNQLHY
jgi:hypothetical protein